MNSPTVHRPPHNPIALDLHKPAPTAPEPGCAAYSPPLRYPCGHARHAARAAPHARHPPSTQRHTTRNNSRRQQGSGHRAPGTAHRAPRTGHRAPGTGHRAPGKRLPPRRRWCLRPRHSTRAPVPTRTARERSESGGPSLLTAPAEAAQPTATSRAGLLLSGSVPKSVDLASCPPDRSCRPAAAASPGSPRRAEIGRALLRRKSDSLQTPCRGGGAHAHHSRTRGNRGCVVGPQLLGRGGVRGAVRCGGR